jgi:hypothetical protein
MKVIELSDEQAEALTARAAAEGMALQEWLGKLAKPEEGKPVETKIDRRPISEVIAEIMKDVPAEEFAQLPKDGASQVDHYVYGLPKRY